MIHGRSVSRSARQATLNKTENQISNQREGKEAFVAPRLERLGTLRELTQGGAGKHLPDPSTGGATRT